MCDTLKKVPKTLDLLSLALVYLVVYLYLFVSLGPFAYLVRGSELCDDNLPMGIVPNSVRFLVCDITDVQV